MYRTILMGGIVAFVALFLGCELDNSGKGRPSELEVVLSTTLGERAIFARSSHNPRRVFLGVTTFHGDPVYGPSRLSSMVYGIDLETRLLSKELNCPGRVISDIAETLDTRAYEVRDETVFWEPLNEAGDFGWQSVYSDCIALLPRSKMILIASSDPPYPQESEDHLLRAIELSSGTTVKQKELDLRVFAIRINQSEDRILLCSSRHLTLCEAGDLSTIASTEAAGGENDRRAGLVGCEFLDTDERQVVAVSRHRIGLLDGSSLVLNSSLSTDRVILEFAIDEKDESLLVLDRDLVAPGESEGHVDVNMRVVKFSYSNNELVEKNVVLDLSCRRAWFVNDGQQLISARSNERGGDDVSVHQIKK